MIMMMVDEVISLIKVGVHCHRSLARIGKLERSRTSPRRTHRRQHRVTPLTAARLSRLTIATMAGATTAGDASWMTDSEVAIKAVRRARGISRTEAKAHPLPRRAGTPLVAGGSRTERDGEAPTASQGDQGVI